MAVATLIATLAAASPPVGVRPPHHRDGGFQNNHLEFEPKGFGTLLRWRAAAIANGLPPPPQAATPRVVPELAWLHTNARAGSTMQPAVTWIGHATVLAQFGGLNWITDPMFSERASPVSLIGPKRVLPPAPALAELPHIDVVLISHDHYDHLDTASVRALAAQAGGPPLFIVPLGLKAWLAEREIHNAVELDWWQSHRVGAAEVVLTPVQHWSGRSYVDRMQRLWGGFAVFAPDIHLFFAGDTAYSPDFAEIRRRFAARQVDGGFDLALIPLGAYAPRWFMAQQHVNPGEAVRIHADLGARRSLGIHWGTFELSDEALDEPPRVLAAARRELGVADDVFFTMAIGQTRRLPPRAPAASRP